MALPWLISLCLSRPGQGAQPRVATYAVSEEEKINKQKKMMFGLGVTEVVIGSLSFMAGIAGDVVCAEDQGFYYYDMDTELTYVSSGIWCGAFLIISGVLGIQVGRNPTASMFDANLAMSAISAVMTTAMAIISMVAAASGFFNWAVPVINVLLAILGVVGLMITMSHISSSSVGCSCRRKSSDPRVQYIHHQPVQPLTIQLPNGQLVHAAQPQQVIQLPNGQLAVLHAVPQTPVYPTAGVPVSMMRNAIPCQTGVQGSYMVQPANGQTAVYPTAGVPVSMMQNGQTTVQGQPMYECDATGMSVPQNHRPPNAPAAQVNSLPQVTQQQNDHLVTGQEKESMVGSDNPPAYTE